MAPQANAVSHRIHWGPTTEQLISKPTTVPLGDHLPGSCSSLRSYMPQPEARAGEGREEGTGEGSASIACLPCHSGGTAALEVLLPARGGELEDGSSGLYRCKACGAVVLL